MYAGALLWRFPEIVFPGPQQKACGTQVLRQFQVDFSWTYWSKAVSAKKSIYISIHVCTHHVMISDVSFQLFTYLSIDLSNYVFIHLSSYLPTYLSIYLLFLKWEKNLLCSMDG